MRSPPPPTGPPPPPPRCFATAQWWRRSPCTGPSRGPRWGWRTPPQGSGRRWRVRVDSGEIWEEMAWRLTKKVTFRITFRARPSVSPAQPADREGYGILGGESFQDPLFPHLRTHPTVIEMPPPKKKTKGSRRLGAFFIHGMRGRRRLRFSPASFFGKRRSPKNVTDALSSGGRKRRGTHISVKTPFVSSSCFRCVVHISIKCTCIVPRLV